MRDDNFDNREQRLIDNAKEASVYYKDKLASELEGYRAVKRLEDSAIKDSLDNLTGNDINNQNSNSNSLGERSNVRVRTLTPYGAMPANNNVNNSNNSNNSNPFSEGNNHYYGNSYENNYSATYTGSMNGAISTLILAGVIALIVLVLVVSLVIMNYVGL